MRRVTAALALIGPTVRAMRRGPLLGAAGAGLLVVAVPVVLGVDLGVDDHANLIRLAAVCASVGLAFVFDDPAKPTTVVVPVPRWLPAAIRALAAALAFAVWWVAAVAVTGDPHLPVGGLTLEVATIGGLSLLAAATAWRWAARGVGGPVAAPAALLLVLAVALVPVRPPMFVPATSPAATWAGVHHRWTVLFLLIAAASVVTVAAPGRRAVRTRGDAGDAQHERSMRRARRTRGDAGDAQHERSTKRAVRARGDAGAASRSAP
ncbi:hypothetical protein [Dactylosporangium sp. CS-033363]|uniref:hypothetical protein n=1 Tax=Dactylosporangium sp. CS-033363 TaxID=3239935 RepID=UPI003D935E28